jgi:hypothetical protein
LRRFSVILVTETRIADNKQLGSLVTDFWSQAAPGNRYGLDKDTRGIASTEKALRVTTITVNWTAAT